MKISKLFHWLYAFIMFLPVFAVGGKLAYTIFNKNAYESYSNKYVEKITYVNSNTLLIENSQYIVNYNNTTGDSGTIYISDTNFYDYFDTNGRTITSIHFVNESYARINLNFSTGETARINNWNTLTTSFNITFSSTNITNITNITHAKLYLLTYTNNSLDNAFYYAVDQVRDNVLFSWANNSFLATPITYVTDLFGMPSDSPIITYLSYWLDISIIWLTFDVILYVPLLVHRWLDKGVLE